MTFILEKISEEDKKKYNLDSKLSSGSSRKTWAIDREREIFLIKPEKAAMGVGRYELHYQNLGIVNFDAEEGAGHETGVGNNPRFNLNSLRVPLTLKSQIEIIKSDIYQSLNTFGYFANPERKEGNAKITLLDDSKIFFKQGE